MTSNSELSQMAGVDRVALEPTEIVSIGMSDGITIAAAIYRPPGAGRFPCLLAASPYRFDNNNAPSNIFLWRETGPIAWYVGQGYAYIHMDVRGTGRSTGEYHFMDEAEQRDLYEVIEWIANQPWSNGKVGGIGQSYYALMQWWMGVQNPPHLACIAPYDGFVDAYQAMAYTGGVPTHFVSTWFETVRMVNKDPVAGPSRRIPWDFPLNVRDHPCYDAFWRERSQLEKLDQIRVPVFSIGLWSKLDLHLDGNILGFQRAGGHKKLMITGSDRFGAVTDYDSVEFHQKYLLPFYDWCLKGVQTPYLDEPTVRYYLNGADQVRNAISWPPPGIVYQPFYFAKQPSANVTSLNDGSLIDSAPGADGGKTLFNYPDPGWRYGVVGPGPNGLPDPVRRVLTFTSKPLDHDVCVVGPIKLSLYASSTKADTDFIVKIVEQMPLNADELSRGVQPRSRLVSKGWLRASLREINLQQSEENKPRYTADASRPLTPDEVYKFEIAIMPAAYLLKKGTRIRVEIANGDSPITDNPRHHEYAPYKLGADTLYHNERYPSHITLPVMLGDVR